MTREAAGVTHKLKTGAYQMKAGWVVSAFLFALVAAAATSAVAADVAWMRTYDGASTAARSIARDDQGNLLVTGEARSPFGFNLDYTTIKYLPNGDTAWVRRYNSDENVNDVAVAVGVDGEGNVYVTGHTDPGTGFPDKKVVTVKYDPAGTLLWKSEYAPEFTADSNHYAVPIDMAVDAEGNAYIAGYILGPAIAKDALVIKLRPNGDTAWVRTYGGSLGDTPYTDTLNAIVVDASGNVYATGSSGFTTNSRVLTMAFDASGASLWTSVLEIVPPPEFGDDVAYDIAIDDAGSAYVTGTAGSFPYSDIATIKYRPNGDTAWMRRYDGTYSHGEQGKRLAIDGAGDIVVGGMTATGTYVNDLAILKYTLTGDLVWSTVCGRGPADDKFADMAVTSDNWIWVTDAAYNSGTNWDWLTIRLDPWGDSTWANYHAGPGPVEYDTDIPAGIVASDATHAWVTGLQTDQSMGSDYLTIAYSISCCRGQVGNIDGDPNDVLDISDVVTLVDYLFFGGSITSCTAEADIDLSGSVDIGDLSALIDAIILMTYVLPDCP
jgi:hypothetical protein